MTRCLSPQPLAWRARLLALLATCVLVGQSLLGSFQFCAIVEALASDCCPAPCAGEAAAAAHEGQSDLGALVVIRAAHAADDACPCPFECALGCCAPARAVVEHAVALGHAVAVSGRLAPGEVEQAPASPDRRGILHVPKLAA